MAIWWSTSRGMRRRLKRGIKPAPKPKAAKPKRRATWQGCRVHLHAADVLEGPCRQEPRAAGRVDTFIASPPSPRRRRKPLERAMARGRRPDRSPKVPKHLAADHRTPAPLPCAETRRCWPTLTFPKEHRTKLHSTNPIERLNGEIKRRTDVVAHLIFPMTTTARSSANSGPAPSCSSRTTNGPFSAPAVHDPGETISQMSDDPLVSLPAVAR